MVENPVVIGIRRDVGLLVRICPQIVDFGKSERSKWLGPNTQQSLCSLLEKDQFPVLETYPDKLAVVVKVEERFAWRFFRLAGEVWQNVVPVKVNLDEALMLRASMSF